MNHQFKNIIHKSMDSINNGKLKFDLIGISDKAITLEPRFYKTDDNTIKCYQYDGLGFYVLRNAFRGILLSINYLIAGDLNLSKKLLGPAVSNYYSAAYHILGTFLALKGRVIFDNQIIIENNKIVEDKRFAIASFSKGKWHFNSKKWGHAGKWQEIKQLSLKEYPNSLIHLFEYWYKLSVI